MGRIAVGGGIYTMDSHSMLASAGVRVERRVCDLDGSTHGHIQY